jgi:ABC-2 type transport system ATP-binding protein
MRAELSDAEAMSGALQLLVAGGVTSIQTSRPSLEEVYVHIIGDRGLQVGA